MNNLFSIFDPSSWLNLNLNWLSTGIFIFLMFPNFWALKSFSPSLLSGVKKNLYQEFYPIMAHSHPSSLTLLLLFFFFIVMNNLMGLFPFIFTSSSHLVFTLAITLPLWSGHTLYFWTQKPEAALSHLVPSGTPSFLMPFMVLIELVSSLIRPITLSVRLAANMVAGHLLITLLTSACQLNLFIMMILLSLCALLILEIAVALIQSYVFNVLMVLYTSEVGA